MRVRLLSLFVPVLSFLASCGDIRGLVSQDMPASTTDVVQEQSAILSTSVPATATPMPPTVTVEILTATPVAPSATPAEETVLDVAALDPATAAPTAAPTPINEVVHPSAPAHVQIATINLDKPLIPVGLDQNYVPIVPRHDIGWYQYSALPGQGENVVLWGHVLRFTDSPNIPAPFARLSEVPIGETITVYTEDEVAHNYIVTEHVWAMPDQVEYILPQGQERLTLVSCIGDKVIIDGSMEMSHRLITIARPAS